MTKLRLALLFGGLLATWGVFAAPADERSDLMKANDASLQLLLRQAVGQATPYDAAMVKTELEGIRSRIETFITLFPEGSEGGRASPEIWNDRAGFEAKAAELSSLVDRAVAAAPDNPKDLIAFVIPVDAACKACHDQYRD